MPVFSVNIGGESVVDENVVERGDNIAMLEPGVNTIVILFLSVPPNEYVEGVGQVT